MSDRKQQILATAAEILEHKSFAAFSYQDLAERLEIRKASIHHHFATKADLGVALIEFYNERGNAMMREMLAEAETPGAALRAIFTACESVLLDGDAKVCPTQAFQVDARHLTDNIRDALRESELGFVAQIAELLEAARAAGEIAFLGDAKDQAATLVCALQGARVSEPIMGRDLFRGVVRQLQRGLGL